MNRTTSLLLNSGPHLPPRARTRPLRAALPAPARVGLASALVTLAACPPPTASTSESDTEPAETVTTAAPTGSSSEVSEGTETSTVPTTGTTTTTTDTTTTTGSMSTTGSTSTTGVETGTETDTDTETTGSPVDVGAARVYYQVHDEQDPTRFGDLRLVEIVDHVASAPVTVIDAQAALDYQAFFASPDRSRLVYALDAPAQAWLVDAATGEPTLLELPPAVQQIGALDFSSDGSLLWITGAPENGAFEVYLCTVEPGECSPEPMNPAFSPTGGLHPTGGITLSPANTWALYSADVGGDGGYDVLLGKTDEPGVATTLMSLPGPIGAIGHSAFTSDEAFLYFAVNIQGLYELHAVDLQQDPPVAVSLDVLVKTGRMAPDRSAIVVWTGEGPDGDLWKVPLDGLDAGEPVQLNTSGPGHVYLHNFAWSPDSKHVTFVSDHEIPGTRELYVVDSEGPPVPIKLSAPIAAGGGVDKSAFTSDSSRVVHHARLGMGAQPELFLTDLTAPDKPVKLNAPLSPTGAVSSHRWSDDETRLLYDIMDPMTNAAFLVDPAGVRPPAPVKITQPFPPGDSLYPTPSFSPDGERFFFAAGPYEKYALYTVEWTQDGPSAPLRLSGPNERVFYLEVFPPAP